MKLMNENNKIFAALNEITLPSCLSVCYKLHSSRFINSWACKKV